MDIQLLHGLATTGAAATLLAFVRKGWQRNVAVAELIVGLLLILLTSGMLEIPSVPNVVGYGAFLAFAGWIPLWIVGRAKPIVAAASVGTWTTAVLLCLRAGWIDVDVIGRLFDFG